MDLLSKVMDVLSYGVMLKGLGKTEKTIGPVAFERIRILKHANKEKFKENLEEEDEVEEILDCIEVQSRQSRSNHQRERGSSDSDSELTNTTKKYYQVKWRTDKSTQWLTREDLTHCHKKIDPIGFGMEN